MKKFLLFIVPLLSLSLECSSYEFQWDIDFGAVFDNREGDGYHTPSETYFLTSLAAEAGLKFTEYDRIAGGAVWTQPLDNSIKGGRIAPTIYYRHSGPKWKFSMGMFPMSQLKEVLPGFLWSDSLTYFQKNIRGALVQFENDKGYFDAYIDWRGMQSKKTREAFNIVFHGHSNPWNNLFFLGGYAMMNHLAKSKANYEDQYVVDNFMLNPYIGLDFSKKTPLDTLSLKVGGIIGFDRNREHGKWEVPGGFLIDIIGEWKFLGLRNSLYAGKKLFPLYGEFGTLLYQGEPYYASPFYDRLDIYAKIYRNKFMELEAQLNFNFTDKNFEFYQRLLLNIEIGNLTERNKRKVCR